MRVRFIWMLFEYFFLCLFGRVQPNQIHFLIDWLKFTLNFLCSLKGQQTTSFYNKWFFFNENHIHTEAAHFNSVRFSGQHQKFFNVFSFFTAKQQLVWQNCFGPSKIQWKFGGGTRRKATVQRNRHKYAWNGHLHFNLQYVCYPKKRHSFIHFEYRTEHCFPFSSVCRSQE